MIGRWWWWDDAVKHAHARSSVHGRRHSVHQDARGRWVVSEVGA